MRLLLSILLINLIFVSTNSVLREEIDETNKNNAESFQKLQKYYRYLDESNSDEISGEESSSEEGDSETEEDETTPSTDVQPQNGTLTDQETNAPAPDTSRTTTPPTQSPPPVPEQTTPPPPSTSRYAAIHVLGYNNFNLEPQPTEPSRPTVTLITITFNLHVYYYGYTPFRYITMTLKITTVILRGLQEGERVDKNATTLCEYNSFDNENHICLYDCNAETDVQPTAVQSYNDYKFKVTANAQPIEIRDSHGDLSVSLSPDAQFASLNLMNQTSSVTKFVTLNNGYIFSNDSSTFYIRGNLVGQNANEIAGRRDITFTFYDNSTGLNEPENVTCLVTNHDVDNFELKCEPRGNLTSHLYESSAVINDVKLSLNMTEQDYVSILKYGPKSNNNGNNNLFYRKSSSGLSGGAIAGIVIACAVVLIIITVLAMFLRNRKVAEVNNVSSIEGLKNVDNYAE
jgi:hypothetical protein